VAVRVGRGSPQGWGYCKVPLGVNPLGLHHEPYPTFALAHHRKKEIKLYIFHV